MKLQRLKWRSALLGTVFLSAFLVALCIVIRIRRPQPRIALVGKWRSIPDPAGVQNQTYEFYADGRFVRKEKVGIPTGPTTDVVVNQLSRGHYRLLPNNELILTTEKFFMNGEYWGLGYGGYNGSIKLQVDGEDVITDFPDQTTQHWQRTK